MNNIEWNENAVCAIEEMQFFTTEEDGIYSPNGDSRFGVNSMFFDERKKVQLNEIRIGDYIEASELDTEQKYNDVVEVFGLFGFEEWHLNSGFSDVVRFKGLAVNSSGGILNADESCKRKLTYPQIIAIGKLKRLIDGKSQLPKFTVETPMPEVKEPKKSAKDYLNECIEVQKQRGEQYDSSGTGERSFAACATAYNAITGGNLKGSDICLVLQILKDVRQYSNPSRLHEDSLLDKVSYSSLHVEELNKELI